MFHSKDSSLDIKILQKKPKLNKRILNDLPIEHLGFEYGNDILKDNDLFRKIFQTNTYLPPKEFLIDYNYEFSKIMVF